MILGKFINPTGAQFPPLWNGDNNNTYVITPKVVSIKKGTARENW